MDIQLTNLKTKENYSMSEDKLIGGFYSSKYCTTLMLNQFGLKDCLLYYISMRDGLSSIISSVDFDRIREIISINESTR